MDCAESSCDTVKYETFPVRTVTSFVKITLEKCAINGVGGFREIRALSTAHDGKISKVDRLLKSRHTQSSSRGHICAHLPCQNFKNENCNYKSSAIIVNLILMLNKVFYTHTGV